MYASLGIVGPIVFIAFGIAQVIAGFIGIEHGFGSIWAWIALFTALVFLFTLLITASSFSGTMHVWGWRWVLAALFAAPILLLGFLGVSASAFPWSIGNTYNGHLHVFSYAI